VNVTALKGGYELTGSGQNLLYMEMKLLL